VPTYGKTRRFKRDFARLTQDQKQAFRAAVRHFIADLSSGSFRKGLRVKGVKGSPGLFEMAWAPDGRATFQYGEPVISGEPHIIWRRIGTHEIFVRP